jgi:serine/threonine-protein kinase RsbW
LEGTAEAVSSGLQEMFAYNILARLSEDSRGTVEILLAEVLNNVVEHAYSTYPGQIQVSITPGDGYLFLRLVDQGLPMPGGDAPGGKLSALGEFQNLPEGGFGWFLIRSLSRDLTYARDGSDNVVSFCVDVDYLA